MSDGTHIEWTDATANVVNGCSVLSAGCTNCYAMRLAGTRLQHHPSRTGLTQPSKAGPVWNGEVRFHEPALQQVLRWRRPRKIFWNAHGDLFHDSVPDEWIDRCFATMALTPQHIHQVLTKRSARMRDYVQRISEQQCNRPYDLDYQLGDFGDQLAVDGASRIDMAEWPLPNVWLGVSVEDQTRADERIPDLLDTPAAVRWLSCEPLLGEVDLGRWLEMGGLDTDLGLSNPGLDWIVVGGESGPGARPMHPDWARGLRDQCATAGVPFLFKQWGEWEVSLDRERDDPDWRADYSNDYVDHGKSKWLNLAGGCGFHGERFHVMRRVGKKRAGRLLDGVEHNGFPEVAA